MTAEINSHFKEYTSVYLITGIKCGVGKHKINQLSYFQWVDINPNLAIHVFVSERIISL